MRRSAIASVLGGALAMVVAVVALAGGGADTAIVGAWVTLAAGVLGVLGAAPGRARPGLAVLSSGLAFATALLVAPGVIPAIADTAFLLFGYFAALLLLLSGAILAHIDRRKVLSAG